jgi:predicted RNA binding protein YcfA (HicA-like mRNA interferase family)
MSKVQRMKVYERREFEKILSSNGYTLKRNSGSHHIYVNESGRHITVKYPINPCISRRLIKEYELKIID